MTNLVIDTGNTFTKISVFENNQPVYFSKLEQLNIDEVLLLIQKFKIRNVIHSSVSKEIDLDIIPGVSFYKFNHQTKIPVKNNYGTPETLGLDRLAAVIGANYLYPKQAILVIDAGTCITYDFINQEKYAGGSISPGLQMRLKSMHQFTGKLPELDFDPDVNVFTGSNTKESMLSGVINGLLFEVTGYMSHFLNDQPDTKIILCGGDSSFFDTRLKNSIFAHQILLEPQLVSIGLNTVVNYQHDQN